MAISNINLVRSRSAFILCSFRRCYRFIKSRDFSYLIDFDTYFNEIRCLHLIGLISSDCFFRAVSMYCRFCVLKGGFNDE